MKRLFLGFVAFIFHYQLLAQCPIASFSLPDTTCAGSPLPIINNSTGSGLSFKWDFCPKELKATNTYAYYSSNGWGFNGLYNFDLLKLKGKYYIFSSDVPALGLINIQLGTNLLTTTPNGFYYASWPAIVDGFDYMEEDTTAYGIATYSQNNSMYRISFPNGIDSNMVGSQIAGVGNLNTPATVKLIKLNGTFYCYVVNTGDNSISCFSFGNSLTNNPTFLYNYVVVGSNQLKDIDIITTCNPVTGFVCSVQNGDIIKLNFGTDLTLPPTQTNLGAFNSTGNNSIAIGQEDDQYYVFFSDIAAQVLKKLAFSNNDFNSVPVVSTFTTPYSLIREIQFLNDSSKTKLVVGNQNSFVEQIFEDTCSGVFFSEDQSPSFAYFSTGWKHLSLTVTDSLGYTSVYADSIYIVQGPTSNFSFSGNTCYSSTNSISFTDLSSAPTGSINSWSWDFDDGTFSSLQNPTHQFPGPGTYNVKLTVQAGCEKDTIITVIIKPTPQVAFTSVNGCAGSDIPFTDQTNTNGATVQSWAWNFGDGTGISNSQNPSYSYSLGGTYFAQLVVTTTDGCADSTIAPVAIKATPAPAFAITNTCVGDTVQFINQSTINDSTALTYLWDFGNAGATSALESPTYPYPSAGNYTVTLIAFSNQGCSDTLIQNVAISTPPSAIFSFPASNCQNANVQFTDNSTGAGISSWVWDFGDGDSSFVQNPVHVFSGNGNYNVTLLVSAGNNCTASVSNIVTVIPGPTAQFSAPPVCDGSATNFTDLSTAPTGSTITSWYYAFGDGNGVSNANPQYTYSAAGTYFAVLEVIAGNGCVDTLSQPVVVNELPFSNFIVQNQRCEGSPIFFLDQSSVNNSVITSWQWSFSDGDSSTQQDPSHTFNTTGSANATLIVTSFEGCTDDITKSFDILPKPQFTFSYSGKCLGDTTRFTYSPIGSGGANFAWSWVFGDNTNAFIPNPKHKYASAGTYNIALIVTDSSGCTGTVFDTLTIYGKPNAAFITNGICEGEPVQFVNQTSAQNAIITGWNWNFGDTQSATDSSVNHSYSAPGFYNATLIVLAEGSCNDTAATLLNIKPKPSVDFSIFPTTASPNTPVIFTNNSSMANQFLWQFGSGLPTAITQYASFTYTTIGTYEVTLTGTTLFGCSTTVSKFIDVIDPKIDLVMRSVNYSVSDDYLQLNALIANTGNTNAFVYDLEVEVDGGKIIIETGKDTIPFTSEKIYKVNSRFKISENSLPVYACVRILNVNNGPDGDMTNNEKCVPLSNDLQLASVNPNPVNDLLNIAYSLHNEGTVKIELYDSRGRLTRDLFSATVAAGLSRHSFNVYDLNGGVYHLRLQVLDEIRHIKFIKN